MDKHWKRVYNDRVFRVRSRRSSWLCRRYGTIAEAARLNLRDDVELAGGELRRQTLKVGALLATLALLEEVALSPAGTSSPEGQQVATAAPGPGRALGDGRRGARPRRLRRRRRRTAPTARPCARWSSTLRAHRWRASSRLTSAMRSSRRDAAAASAERRALPPREAATTLTGSSTSPTARRPRRTSGSWRASSRRILRVRARRHDGLRELRRGQLGAHPSSSPTTRAACGRSRCAPRPARARDEHRRTSISRRPADGPRPRRPLCRAPASSALGASALRFDTLYWADSTRPCSRA